MIIKKEFEFHMTHRLSGYEGNCHNLHGHSYRLIVGVVETKLDRLGMALDFKDLKVLVNHHILNKVDHSTWLKDDLENSILIKVLKSMKMKLIITNYNPTAENMILDFWEILSKAGIPLYTLILYETNTSSVTINKSDYERLRGNKNESE